MASMGSVLCKVFLTSTAMVFLRRRKGARTLLIVGSCCVLFLRHREGVDVFQPKGWFCELFSDNFHDSAVVVVCACVVSVGFASVPLFSSGRVRTSVSWTNQNMVASSEAEDAV